jgi:hypothetical protein
VTMRPLLSPPPSIARLALDVPFRRLLSFEHGFLMPF